MTEVSAAQTVENAARPVVAPYGYERTFTVGADGTFASAASGGYSEQKGVAAVEI